MADSAFQVQYRQEFIAQFEQGQSWLRNVCTTDAKVTRFSFAFSITYDCKNMPFPCLGGVRGILTAYAPPRR
jgi:hypothetical protein